MKLASLDTALSPNVKNLICRLGCGEPLIENESQKHGDDGLPDQTHREASDTGGSLLTSAGYLDLDGVASLLPALDDGTEYFERAVTVLSPVFMQCQTVFISMSDECIYSGIMPRLCWTHSEKVFCDCLKMLREEKIDSCTDILVLLLTSAILERALGNVFLLQGTQCPSMLKDLLVTPELSSILGDSVIKILRVLIGPPTSLNLRNVAWHGFLGDEELSRRYCCFLVFLAASVGDILAGKGISVIPLRPYVVLTPSVKQTVLSALQVTDFAEETMGLNLQSVTDILRECLMIQPQTEQQWQLAFHLYKQGSYGYCLALLLPLMEHCLRRMFATVNDCPERVLTAESSAFYTTFNEILDQTLADGTTNKLPEMLTTSCMDLLHDLLFYPEGPRIRDHLSHGEVDFTAVDEALVFPFICIAIFMAYQLLSTSSSLGDTCLKMVEKVKVYKSVFHPVAILQQKFCALLRQLDDTPSCVLVSANLEPIDDGPSQLCEDNILLMKTQQIISQLWECDPWIHACLLSEEDLANGFNMRLDPLKQISEEHIPTLFRWQSEGESARPVSMRESEFVGLLLRITEECTTATEQMQLMLQHRQKQLFAKELRSRQRENLKKLLSCIPCLQMLVAVLSACTGWNMHCLNHFSTFTTNKCRMIQKFLKLTLQQCENLRTLTSGDKNKWTESVDLLLSWIPKCRQFFVQWQKLSESDVS